MKSTRVAAALPRDGGASRLLVALVLSACFSAVLSAALTTEVNAGEIFIVTESLGAGRELYFQFALHPDYLLPVTIKDRGTNEGLMHWKDLAFGAFAVPVSDKPRNIIISFDNSNTMFTSKNVNFDLRTSVNVNYAVDAWKLDPIEQKIRALSGSMQQLKTLQVSIRNQQKNHRDTVESANERVLLWSIFQVLAFLIMLSFQLFMLRRLLEKKTYV
ncbi:conserved hypothetical protein [Leishmania major strain Friedlin]|uniref:GOLD domain-containing protein n=1 Tax=Leishmania major TaxID=5664 RepID=Q4Q6F2_LEIMA|nr:conserved hypothetical protein [Leishmania major strain Friedlin]CAG9579275.1 hypothetical_protein_-_conserved [Leishmania major strain Friedlin]CAJ08298.1 conserved hypothetical protein [Leishmania major strain Friedlin]|eukprot:XP_001685096.1 conserved hypothetical protein [Leishmania major strain Friedlin]